MLLIMALLISVMKSLIPDMEIIYKIKPGLSAKIRFMALSLQILSSMHTIANNILLIYNWPILRAILFRSLKMKSHLQVHLSTNNSSALGKKGFQLKKTNKPALHLQSLMIEGKLILKILSSVRASIPTMKICRESMSNTMS